MGFSTLVRRHLLGDSVFCTRIGLQMALETHLSDLLLRVQLVQHSIHDVLPFAQLGLALEL